MIVINKLSGRSGSGNRHNLFSQCKNDQCGSKNTHAAVPEKLTINLFWPYRIMLVDCWIKQNFKNPIVLLCHLQFWFCSCVHFQFSVGFVLLILYLCSLPVFSGVCVIDSVPVFASSFQWGLCYWFCMCSLPVFSGVCVIDSVSVFTSSFQWGLCYWFCICVHCQFTVGFVLYILFNYMSLHILFHVVMSAMIFVFIYVYWSPAQFLYQMMFVLFNSNRWVCQC
jgi:hypothetical protein